MRRVLLDPRFQFMFVNRDPCPHLDPMGPDEIRFHIFSKLVDKYSEVLMPSEKLEQFGACPATVLEFFFFRLERIIDMFASVAGYSAIMPPHEHLTIMMSRGERKHPGFLVLLPLGPPDYYRSRFLPLRLCNLFVNTLPPRITLKELAIIKLTAQFAMRYGRPFMLDLMSRVYMEPEFEFLNTH
ncbi:unnamed protein product [Arabis nemorensis]|uniref:SURP motif domain-containing protein n=1 Tax=Arabis nemorensis TaxID=586526 RepID=A0A565CMW5_9BRAS|nr:unnamed protein product [Arabis nemorensis]